MAVNSAPLLIAALDAGSNAIRAVVARASSATEIRELANARWAVRLGHGVFTKRRMDSRTMSRAVETFVQFRNMLDRYGVAEYSAVATSAVREAANRDALVSRILREEGDIELADHRRGRRGAAGAHGSVRIGWRKVCAARHH